MPFRVAQTSVYIWMAAGVCDGGCGGGVRGEVGHEIAIDAFSLVFFVFTLLVYVVRIMELFLAPLSIRHGVALLA